MAGKPAAEKPAWSETQMARMEAGAVDRSVDVHCHCLPAIDDGPADLEAAVAMCRALVDDGITSVIATPHQLGKYDLSNSAAHIRQRVQQLNERLFEERLPLEIVPGADVRIDERLPQLIESGEVFTAGDLGTHILLELPSMTYCEPRPLMAQLAERGVQCILTHPERHRYLAGHIEAAVGWIRSGAVVQVTAGSLLGDFGRYAFDYAWRLLQHGLVSIVATDAHDHVQRPPRMTAAYAAIEQHLGSDVARLVCLNNPLMVWRGEAIMPHGA
jgi:protein-tyrosine phosphatase